MSVKLGSKWREIANPRKVATVIDVDASNKTYPLRVSVAWGDVESGGFSGFGESYRCAESYLYCLFDPIPNLENNN